LSITFSTSIEQCASKFPALVFQKSIKATTKLNQEREATTICYSW